MKRVTALFSNMMGQGADYIFLGKKINEITVDNLNAELPTSFVSHFYWGYCDTFDEDISQFDREWFLPHMTKDITIVYNKERQIFIEKVAQ